jgi:hypothetical protein
MAESHDAAAAPFALSHAPASTPRGQAQAKNVEQAAVMAVIVEGQVD